MRKSRLAPLLFVATLLAGAAVLLTMLARDDAPPPIEVPTKPRTPRPKPRPVPDEAFEPLPAQDDLERTAGDVQEPLDDIDEADLVTAITGRVLTPAAIPARGTRVTLLRQLPGSALGPGPTKRAQEPTTVAEDGSFGFTGLKPGANYLVRADHPDYPPAFSTPTRARKDETVELPVVEFVVGCSIVGTVRDEHGRGLSSARVSVFDLVRGFPATATQDRVAASVISTDERGVFNAERLAPGVYEVVVVAPKFEAAITSNIDLSAPRSEKRVDVTLHPGHSIAGRVLDLASAPVEGARVQAVQVTKDGRRFGSALTRADGRFRIDGLGLGEYRVTVDKAGYSSAQRNRVAADSMTVQFRLAQNAGITGFVYGTDGQTPVPAFGIMLHELGKGDHPNRVRGGMQSFSARDGSFTLEDVPPGRYRLQVFASGFGPTWSEPVDVERIFVHGVKVALEVGATLRGTVVDVDGRPAAGATVLLLENTYRRGPAAALLYGSYTHYASAKTAADGTFAMQDLEPKRYQVEVQAPERMTLSKLDVDVAKGANDVGTLVLRIGGGVKGYVVNERGAPGNAARVTARNPKTQVAFETTCNVDGAFEFRNLEPGDWLLVPSPPANDPFANHPLTAITIASFSQMTVTVVEGRSESVTLPIKTSR